MPERVGIIGVGQTVGKRSRKDVSEVELVNEAVRAALEDAELTIKDIGKRGDGVAFFDKYVVYVAGAVKGSVVKVKIEKISGTVAFGRIVS